MPRRRTSLLACCVAATGYTIPAASETIALQSGRYEIEVRLELPHLDDRTATKVTQVCLSTEAGANNHGLAVLSDNNPLTGCPILNRYEDGRQIAFDIACEGKNSAKAKASYTVVQDRFQGRIVMQMGGKNMTMTEVQTGRRTGTCEPGTTPAR